MQLVLCGDFLQLPPVTRDRCMKFAFEAKSWRQCIEHEIILTKVFRQENQTLVNLLNELRIGKCSKSSEDLLRSRIRTQLDTSGNELRNS